MITVKRFTFNYFGENTYLIFDETREAVIIDCGCINRQEETALSGAISDNKLIIKRLLSTHYHFDHVVGNGFIFMEYGISPEMHRNERNDNTPSLDMQARAFRIPGTFKDVETKHFIEENEEVRFGNVRLTALLVPGHSPASLAFYSEADKVVFTGDALFYGSIGRTDLWGGNYNTLITSIKEKLLTLPGNTVVYPGHGESTSVGFEKANNPYCG
ncbi:MAG: MBL fold metallo-hydrolase [Tannerella sp.]|jgi:glyoxylase-like metal-dependent hydrolase (beta-lactamase superfamily II)|nr:MBL fold metallo-hydrolase [Tannerella sp.]